MTFYIYDAQGYQHPYTSGVDWRCVRRRENVTAIATHEKSILKNNSRKKIKKTFEDHRFDKALFGKKSLVKEALPQLVAMQIMRAPVTTLFIRDPISEAIRLFTENRFRHIPILNENGEIAGIISDRCLAGVMFEKGSKYCSEVESIEDIMTTKVLTAEPMTPVSKIASIFIEERIGSMPIVDQEKRLVGILTRSDILRTIIKLHTGELRV